jgi:signal transduction histidine kinase
MKTVLHLVFAIFCSLALGAAQSASAQVSFVVDSLQRALRAAPDDTSRISALCRLSNTLVIFEQKDSLGRVMAKEALHLAERLRENTNFPFHGRPFVAYYRALALQTLGTTYRFTDGARRPLAEPYFQAALDEAQRIPDTERSLQMQADVQYAWFTGLRFRIDTHFKTDRSLPQLREDVRKILAAQQIIADKLNSNALRGQILLCRAFILTDVMTQKLLLTIESVSLYEQSGDVDGLATALSYLGYFAELIGDNARAMKAYQRAVQVGAANNLPKTLSIAYHAIGDIYAKLADTTKALEYYYRAEPFTERYDVWFNYIDLLQKIGTLHQQMNAPDKAQQYFERAIALNHTMGEEIYNIIRRAWLYRGLGKLQEALEELRRGQAIAEQGAAIKPKYDFLYEIALTYKMQALKMRKTVGQEGAFYHNALDSALVCAKKNLELMEEQSQTQPTPQQLLSIYALLYDISKARSYGNITETLHYLEQLRRWEKAVAGTEKSLEIAAMGSRAAVEAVEAKVQALEAQDRLQRTIGIAVGIALLALVVIMVLLLRRTTERKNAAALLAERNLLLSASNQELASLNQEKTTIMGIVAHDLKNPITAIRNLANLIETNELEQKEITIVSRHISSAANQMLELVKNLLDNNRLEEGAMRFCIVSLDVAPCLESIVERYQQLAAAKNITLHYSYEAAHSLALVDEQALMQVLDNLLSNAVKYSPHGKNVFVRLRHSSDQSTNDSIRLEVQDEGQGISVDDMKKLFGKFARLSARPTGGEVSTGLGLSIVKKMVEAMNGKVWCESNVGDRLPSVTANGTASGIPTGATFIVELPSAGNHKEKIPP